MKGFIGLKGFLIFIVGLISIYGLSLIWLKWGGLKDLIFCPYERDARVWWLYTDKTKCEQLRYVIIQSILLVVPWYDIASMLISLIFCWWRLIIIIRKLLEFFFGIVKMVLTERSPDDFAF